MPKAVPKFKVGQVYALTWSDPYRFDGWKFTDEVLATAKVTRCYTTGKVIGLKPDCFVIAPTFTDETDVLNPIVIPYANVISYEAL